MKRIAHVVLAAGALALVPAAVMAAPGGKGGGGPKGGGKGSSSLLIPDGTYGSSTIATVADAPADTWIESNCYQNGLPVLYHRLAVSAEGTAVLQLGPTTGYEYGIGGADCEAEAKYWQLKRQRWVSLGTTRFHVND